MYHDVVVNAHISSRQWGLDEKKNNSWRELLLLLPEGRVNLIPHQVADLEERNWINYLHSNGYKNTETYYYTKKVPVASIEITQYISTLPEIPAEDLSTDFELPEKYITEQWDSHNR